jgi:hypothetical protein
MKALALKLLNHLKYPSSWQGLLAIAAAAGLHLAPDLASQIATLGVALAGFIAFFFSDADVK